MNENIMNICEECGCVEENLVEVTVGHVTRMVCRDCAEALGFVECHDCGEWIRKEDAIETVYGYVICESCYECDYATCEDCGSVCYSDAFVRVNPNTRMESWVCEDCADSNYYHCDHCGNYYDSRFIWADSNMTICEFCRDDYVICEDCGDVVELDDATYNEDDGVYYCEDCADQHVGLIRGYHSHPEVEFFGQTDEVNNLYFGLELEIDDGEDADEVARDIDRLGHPVYFNHDSSLNCGVEIISQPCTLAYHESGMWDEISEAARNNGFTSHDTTTCGLHIHVGLYEMGSMSRERYNTKGKLILISNAISEELFKFSRRNREKFNHWSAVANVADYIRGEVEDLSEDMLIEYAIQSSCASRYHAINIDSSRNTVEFRFFRGTLKVSTILASIQLANNMTKFAMTHTAQECYSCTMNDIVSIEEHSELRTYCEDKGLI